MIVLGLLEEGNVIMCSGEKYAKQEIGYRYLKQGRVQTRRAEVSQCIRQWIGQHKNASIAALLISHVQLAAYMCTEVCKRVLLQSYLKSPQVGIHEGSSSWLVSLSIC